MNKRFLNAYIRKIDKCYVNVVYNTVLDFDDDVEGIRALKGKHICINIRTSNFCGQKRDGGILPDLDMALANRLS